MSVSWKKSRAIFETHDNQLVPLDDIQHINARPKEHQKAGFETITVLYKDGMKVEISNVDYNNLKEAWEERRNGKY